MFGQPDESAPELISPVRCRCQVQLALKCRNADLTSGRFVIDSATVGVEIAVDTLPDVVVGQCANRRERLQ